MLRNQISVRISACRRSEIVRGVVVVDPVDPVARVAGEELELPV
jgi:hypothetical protein